MRCTVYLLIIVYALLMATSVHAGVAIADAGADASIPATDDRVLVGNGRTWDLKSLAACTAPSVLLQYEASTNTISCTAGTALVHNLLSATHSDTVASAASRGAVIVGDSTPKWSLLAVGAANKVLHSDGTDATWQSIVDADVPNNITIDLAATATALAGNGTNCAAGNYPLGVDASGNAESCTAAGGTHTLLDGGTVVTDTAASTVVKGDLIYGNVTPKWERLGGNTTTTSKYLNSTGTGAAANIPSWAQIPFSDLSGSVTDAQVPDNITITLANTATALAANGLNCSGNNFALGVDASGAGECAQPAFTNLSGTASDAQVDGSLEADEVNPTLGTQTQGNYLASSSNGSGITGASAASEGGTIAPAFDYSATLAGDPTMNAGECRFATTGIICEGSSANTFETLITFKNPTADTTFTIVDQDSVSVIPDSGSANNYLTAIASTGVISKSRPACATLSDSGGGCTMSTTAGGDLSGTLPSPTVANISTGATVAGTMIHTNIAAPASPAAGKVTVFTDSTDLRLHDKNASGVIGTTVVADTGAANNFLTAISAAGAISKSQPAFTNISGSVACSQLPALTSDVTTVAGNCATTLARANTVIAVGTTTGPGCANGGGTTTYVGQATSNTTETSVIRFVAPESGTAYKMYVKQQGNTPAGQSAAWTMRLNAASKTITCTVGAGASTCNDTAHTEAVAAGDLIDIMVVCTGGTTALTGPVQIGLAVK